MKRKQFATGAIIAAAVLFPLAAWSQYGMSTAGFVSVGTSTLPAGQYLMSNLSTGQSLYVVVNPQGQMLGQDPRALQVSLQPTQTMPLQTGQPAAPAGIGGIGGSGGGFGGLLKQGLDTFINRNGAPQGQ